jgi:adenylate cyclase class IV
MTINTGPATKIPMQTKDRCIEVEQKFSTANLDKILQNMSDLGFIPGKEIKFMDWYFDNPDFTLCKQDCWLRLRHLSHVPGEKGLWQLKKGRRIPIGTASGSGSTVYEELEGDQAIDIVKGLLEADEVTGNDAKSDGDDATLDGYPMPQIPRMGEYRMKAFARIETTRSSWKTCATTNKESDEVYNNITIDIDRTDFGHTVGEVETVVTSDEEVDGAKALVQQVIIIINGEESSGSLPALGKLESYLIQNRPEVYEACVKSGSMKANR